MLNKNIIGFSRKIKGAEIQKKFIINFQCKLFLERKLNLEEHFIDHNITTMDKLF